jgi:lipoate-protein ligase A
VILPVYFHFDQPADYQMALDEALFRKTAEDQAPGFLRFYTMDVPSATAGYFITLSEWDGPPAVRRLTGGGIVHHGDDLVFSLGLDTRLFPACRRVQASYVKVHSAVQNALLKHLVPAELYSPSSGAAPLGTEGPGTRNLCFERPVPGDLMVGGQKAAGGAQRRRRHHLLHQGSIRLTFGSRRLHPVAFAENVRHSLAALLRIEFRKEELPAGIEEEARLGCRTALPALEERP